VPEGSFGRTGPATTSTTDRGGPEGPDVARCRRPVCNKSPSHVSAGGTIETVAQLTALDVNPFYPALSGWLVSARQRSGSRFVPQQAHTCERGLSSPLFSHDDQRSWTEH